MRKLLLIMMLCLPLAAQVFVQPIITPHIQLSDNSGNPLSGGKVYTYAAGTSTPATTYSNSAGTVPNANPVVLDAGGFGDIWLGPSCYKFVVTDANGVTISTTDNVCSLSNGVAYLNKQQTWTAEQDFGTAAPIDAQVINGTQFVTANTAGSDLCAKIATAINALPSTGGTVNAMSMSGAQSCAADPFTAAGINSSLTKPVKILLPAGTITSTATWLPNSGSVLEGVCGTIPEGDSVGTSGTIMFWGGATSTSMVHYYGTSGTIFKCITLDGNAVAGSIGILTDGTSVGTNHGSHSIFQNFRLTGFQQGMVCGNSSSTPDADIPNGAYDLQELRNFYIGAPSSLTTDEGIHINSDNCFDGGLIENGSIHGANVGINIIRGGGPYFLISRVASGDGDGTDPVFIQLGSGNQYEPDILYTHNEGTTLRYSVHDSTCNGLTSNTNQRSPIWHGNAWGDDVLVDGCSAIISDGNSGYGTNPSTGGIWSVGKSARVMSRWDTPNSNVNHTPWASSWTIDTILNSGAQRNASNVATIKTTTDHALAVGSKVDVTVTSDASFNATGVTILSVPTTKSFTYANAGGVVGPATAGGGTVAGGVVQSVGVDGYQHVGRLIFDSEFTSNQLSSPGTLDLDPTTDLRVCKNAGASCDFQMYYPGSIFKIFAITAAGVSNFYDAANNVVASVSATGALSTAQNYTSTVATGTAPLVVTSTTPVANLAATPTTYNHSGTQQTNSHVVIDTCTLGTSCSVTLTGSAVFTSSSSYRCGALDTTAAAAIKFAPSSGSAFALTGTGTDVLSYVCIGN